MLILTFLGGRVDREVERMAVSSRTSRMHCKTLPQKRSKQKGKDEDYISTVLICNMEYKIFKTSVARYGGLNENGPDRSVYLNA